MNNNKIEDISLLKKENIIFNELQILKINNNHITQGIEILKNEFVTKCLYMNIDISSFEDKNKILIFFEEPNYSFEIYINEINDLKDIITNYKNSVKFINCKALEKFREKLFPPENIDDDINPITKKSDNRRHTISIISDSCGDFKHIIIDNGSGYIKAGFSGEKGPRVVFPSCVGYIKYSSGIAQRDKRVFFVGDDAKERIGILNLNLTIEYGIVNNWDDMEKIWDYVFNELLRVDICEHNVMLTESSMNPKECREKMAQIMFETFNIPGLYIANEGVLSLYNIGKYNGLVADSGDSVTQIVPVFEGFSLPHAIYKLNFGGKDLTKYMMNFIGNYSQIFKTQAEKEIVKAIKEKCCYVALDFEDELKSVENLGYELPDGNQVFIKYGRIECPEALFRPSRMGKEEYGISEVCYNSIQKCDLDIRRDLYNNIVLSGGNTMFNGFPERLTKEIKYLAPSSMKEEIKVIAPPKRRLAVWNGGSIISSNSNFESSWITKNEYDESGNTIVHRKCF